MVLVFVLLATHWISGPSSFLPWPGRKHQPSRPPPPFVIEIEGPLASRGIYTFPKPVDIEEVLLTAGVPRGDIPRRLLPEHLKTGTTLLLERSSEGLHIRTRPMKAAKKVLYGIAIDLNAIRADELPLIPGIGVALAKRIVEYRDRYGHFDRMDELLEVRGIGAKKLQALQPYLMVEKNPSASP